MAALSILTWNIWMMPPWVHQSPKNELRAAAIAERLGELGYDVLCLEKVFDDGARAVIARALEDRYPYAYGPANSGPDLLHINSGVWIVSRIPLQGYREIEFRDYAGIPEHFARKGAMLLAGVVDGRRFQIIATHLTGDDADTHQPDRQAVRNRQMVQIVEDLVKPHSDPFAPLFFCGDFCTPHRDESDHFTRTDAFDFMTTTLGAETADDERITLVSRRSVNDIADDDNGREAELDYILVRKNGTQVLGTWERLIIQKPGWDGGNLADLSYRYAVGAKFIL